MAHPCPDRFCAKTASDCNCDQEDAIRRECEALIAVYGGDIDCGEECICTDWSGYDEWYDWQGCGYGTCSDMEMRQRRCKTRTCTPVGCDNYIVSCQYRCIDDPTCEPGPYWEACMPDLGPDANLGNAWPCVKYYPVNETFDGIGVDSDCYHYCSGLGTIGCNLDDSPCNTDCGPQDQDQSMITNPNTGVTCCRYDCCNGPYVDWGGTGLCMCWENWWQYFGWLGPGYENATGAETCCGWWGGGNSDGTPGIAVHEGNNEYRCVPQSMIAAQGAQQTYSTDSSTMYGLKSIDHSKISGKDWNAQMRRVGISDKIENNRLLYRARKGKRSNRESVITRSRQNRRDRRSKQQSNIKKAVNRRKR